MERERESWQHLVQAEEGSLRSEAARLEWSKGSCAWKGGTSVAPPVGVSFGSGLLELGQRRVLVSQEAAGRGAPGQRPAPVLPWRVHLEECDVTTFSAAGSCGRRVTSAEPLTVPGSWHDGRGGAVSNQQQPHHGGSCHLPEATKPTGKWIRPLSPPR